MNNAVTPRTLAIRPAVREDEATLMALARRLGDIALPVWRTPAEIANADGRAMLAAIASARPDEAVFIAEREGVAVGCLHVLEDTDFFGCRHAHVSVLATTAAAEGSGVGRALLAYADDWGRRRGLSLITLNVFAGNARARRVYDAAGFAPEIVKYAKRL